MTFQFYLLNYSQTPLMWTPEVLYVAAPRKPSWPRWSRLVWRGQQGTTIPPARQADANRMSVIQKYGIFYLT